MCRALRFCCVLLVACASVAGAVEAKPRLPNIVWITSEDHGPHLDCYGNRFARSTWHGLTYLFHVEHRDGPCHQPLDCMVPGQFCTHTPAASGG
jgi:hypothetical protein